MTGPLKEMSLLGLARARFARHRLAVASALVLALLSLLAAAAPMVEAALGVDGEVVDLFNRFAEPSVAHPLARTNWAGISWCACSMAAGCPCWWG